MNVRVAGPAGQQLTAHEVNRRDGEHQIRNGDGVAVSGAIPAGASPAGSSYREMRTKGPILTGHALVGECTVQPFPQPGKRPAADSHPVYPGRAAPGECARPGKPDLEWSDLVERLRRGDEPGQDPGRNVANETHRDVQALLRNPAYGRKELAHGGQRAPQRPPDPFGRPDRVEQAQQSQATGTATGPSTASTP